MFQKPTVHVIDFRYIITFLFIHNHSSSTYKEQIYIAAENRIYIRFLWFEVVFGVTSFLLNGTVKKHPQKYEYNANFVETILRSFQEFKTTIFLRKILFKKMAKK